MRGHRCIAWTKCQRFLNNLIIIWMLCNDVTASNKFLCTPPSTVPHRTQNIVWFHLIVPCSRIAYRILDSSAILLLWLPACFGVEKRQQQQRYHARNKNANKTTKRKAAKHGQPLPLALCIKRRKFLICENIIIRVYKRRNNNIQYIQHLSRSRVCVKTENVVALSEKTCEKFPFSILGHFKWAVSVLKQYSRNQGMQVRIICVPLQIQWYRYMVHVGLLAIPLHSDTASGKPQLLWRLLNTNEKETLKPEFPCHLRKLKLRKRPNTKFLRTKLVEPTTASETTWRARIWRRAESAVSDLRERSSE